VRNRFENWKHIGHYLGNLLIIFGPVMLVPLAVIVLATGEEISISSALPYVLPSALSVLCGLLLARLLPSGDLAGRDAALVCVLAWLVIPAFGAVPFVMVRNAGFLNAYFESVSGFTTTGITMFTGLDAMQKSLLLWRAITQWLGGLGILSFFLVLAFRGGAVHVMVGAESHKIFSRRPAPGMFHTLRILWFIYILFTGSIACLLVLEGLSPFDAAAHSLTTLSTGGYSTHDASIGFYQNSGFAHYKLIEYTIIFGMLLGAINFLVHYRALRGEVGALGDNFEIRLFWIIVAGALVLIGSEYLLDNAGANIEETFRRSLFQAVAILTSTGFGTADIGDAAYFGTAARQIFLLLMVVGGCVGSTSGGVKVLRIGILFKMVRRQLSRIARPSSFVAPLVVDGQRVPEEEVRRVAALFFAWMVLLFCGGIVTALFAHTPDIGPYESFSGMFSALGNIGPCYISVENMIRLNPVVKILYIIGMIAGRLEILPVLLLFSRSTWK